MTWSPTDKWLADLREVVDAATPGPWIQGEDYGFILAKREGVNEWGDPNDVIILQDCETDEDGRFIAWSRVAVPILLDEVDRLRKTLREMQEQKTSPQA